jgi:hypothetical protein
MSGPSSTSTGTDFQRTLLQVRIIRPQPQSVLAVASSLPELIKTGLKTQGGRCDILTAVIIRNIHPSIHSPHSPRSTYLVISVGLAWFRLTLSPNGDHPRKEKSQNTSVKPSPKDGAGTGIRSFVRVSPQPQKKNGTRPGAGLESLSFTTSCSAARGGVLAKEAIARVRSKWCY